jgi:hypothetical protein
MKIIYPHNGGIAVIHPTGEVPIELVAVRDVPSGVPYLFVEDTEVDALDRADRGAWTADFANPDGHGGQE